MRTPDQGGGRCEAPPGDAVQLTPGPETVQTPTPGETQQPAENTPQQTDLAADLFELQHMLPGLKRHRSPSIAEQQEPEQRLRMYGSGDGRERGKRPRIGFS